MNKKANKKPMNKKTYISPALRVINVGSGDLLAGSFSITATIDVEPTDVQYSKRNNISSSLDEEEDMEECW